MGPLLCCGGGGVLLVRRDRVDVPPHRGRLRRGFPLGLACLELGSLLPYVGPYLVVYLTAR